MVDGSSLCARCGLCCDGTLYDNAKAEPHELPLMAAAGLAPLAAGDSFQLPCPRLSGSCCTIYEERFTICRSFRCKLLTRLLAGETGLDEALAKVAEAKRLLAKVAERDPATATAGPRREAAHKAAGWAGVREPAERAAAASSYVELVALESYLNRHFRKVADGKTLLG